MTRTETITRHRELCGECRQIARTGRGLDGAPFCSALQFLLTFLAGE